MAEEKGSDQKLHPRIRQLVDLLHDIVAKKSNPKLFYPEHWLHDQVMDRAVAVYFFFKEASRDEINTALKIRFPNDDNLFSFIIGLRSPSRMDSKTQAGIDQTATKLFHGILEYCSRANVDEIVSKTDILARGDESLTTAAYCELLAKASPTAIEKGVTTFGLASAWEGEAALSALLNKIAFVPYKNRYNENWFPTVRGPRPPWMDKLSSLAYDQRQFFRDPETSIRKKPVAFLNFLETRLAPDKKIIDHEKWIKLLSTAIAATDNFQHLDRLNAMLGTVYIRFSNQDPTRRAHYMSKALEAFNLIRQPNNIPVYTRSLVGLMLRDPEVKTRGLDFLVQALKERKDDEALHLLLSEVEADNKVDDSKEERKESSRTEEETKFDELLIAASNDEEKKRQILVEIHPKLLKKRYLEIIADLDRYLKAELSRGWFGSERITAESQRQIQRMKLVLEPQLYAFLQQAPEYTSQEKLKLLNVLLQDQKVIKCLDPSAKSILLNLQLLLGEMLQLERESKEELAAPQRPQGERDRKQ